MDSDEDEEFQDACEHQPVPSSMDLETALQESKKAMHYFLNNRFSEAQKILEPWTKTSMYHALGNSLFAFLDALLTFEKQHIEAASEALKNLTAVCNRYKRSNYLDKITRKVNYDSYSPEEIHAELCCAEGLLLKSVLTLIEDETLVNFIKAGIKIRACYHSYKECNDILKSRHWKNESHEVHFEAGVRMGIGTFNLMISILPARAIKLLEFAGFSGSKEIGLQQLEVGYRLNSVRQLQCILVLLGYHLFILCEYSHLDGDLKLCDEILKCQLQLYPKGMLFQFFKGRLEFMNGSIDESINWYMAAWHSQNIWPHFHHFCFWELLWTNVIKQDWREASMFALMLLQQSKWSRTVYSYQRAVMLSMLDKSLSHNEKCEIETLMRNAPKLQQKIAGKSLPIEKFVVKKSQRFFAQNQMLVLPAIEMVYLWNLFKVLGKKVELLDAVYKLIEKTWSELEAEKKIQHFDADNRALVLLLKGASLRQMKNSLQAEKCFNAILVLEKQIRDDLYLVPYAMLELAQIMWEEGNSSKAATLLEGAKKNYSGYCLESRLHFMIHTFEMEMKEGKPLSILDYPMPSTSSSN